MPTDLQPDGEFDSQGLRQLAARASTLLERLSGTVEPSHGDEGSRRLTQWREAAAAGRGARFQQRLAQLELSPDSAPAWLGDVTLAPDSPLPAWAARLPELLDPLTHATPEPPDSNRDTEPFGHFFLPLGELLASRLWSGVDPRRWDPRVRRVWCDDLVRRLAPVFFPTLQAWFESFRTAKAPEGAWDGTDLYFAFIDWLRRGQFVRILVRRPMLARLLCTATCQWETAARELVARFEADRDEIVRTYFSGHDPGAIIVIDTGVADRHDDGRAVAVLTFADGRQVVYKPKDLRIDAAWRDLLGWLNAHDAPCTLPTVEVIVRSGYGWTDFVASAPVADNPGARRFFHRAGGLLALFHLLGSTDFHQENIVASAAGPTAIDLETLLRPRPLRLPIEPGRHPATQRAHGLIQDSVLATAYLPKWVEFRGESWANGGLSHTQSSMASVPGCHHRNTNRMAPGPVAPPRDSMRHLPTLDGKVLNASDYVDEIEAGFAAMAEFVLRHRHRIAAGPLRAFRSTTVRVVRRDTQLYHLLQQRLLQPAALASGADFGIEVEFLARAAMDQGDIAADLLAAEHAALARLDIPLLRMRADGTLVTEASGVSFDLDAGLGRILSPYAHAEFRLAALSSDDIARQRRFIRAALESHRFLPLRTRPWTVSSPARWSPDQAIDRAVAMGRRLARLGIEADDGLAWLGTVAVGRQERLQLDVVGWDLYSGVSGLAVFFAALGCIAGREEFGALCRRTLAPLDRLLGSDIAARELVRGLGLGGAAGVGSIIYAHVLGSTLLDDPGLLDPARTACALLTAETIAAETNFDVIGGLAGAILSTLALAPHEPAALETAKACGERLLALADPAGDRPPTAPTPRRMAGFSHGAAGIALALVRLGDALHEPRYHAAAARWIEFERSLFHPAAGNWLDVRFQTPAHAPAEHFVSNWCHGAAGIGLARCAAFGASADAETRREIQTAAARSIESPMSDLDHLCCGNFGRLEHLLYAGNALDRSDWIALAHARAAERLDETRDGHRWRMGKDEDNPGLFQGVAGIGYELLRLARPDQLPSVLTWETLPAQLAEVAIREQPPASTHAP